jgi:hypothetical protein
MSFERTSAAVIYSVGNVRIDERQPRRVEDFRQKFITWESSPARLTNIFLLHDISDARDHVRWCFAFHVNSG